MEGRRWRKAERRKESRERSGISYPDMKFRFCKIGHIAGQSAGVLMKALAHQNPSHVGPPFAVERSVGITFFVRKLMMNAMGCNPENRSAFEGDSCANGYEILHTLWSFVSAMC